MEDRATHSRPGVASGRRPAAAAALAAAAVVAMLALAGCAPGSGRAPAPDPVSAADGGTCRGRDITATAAQAVPVRAAVLCLINAERRQRGLGALVEDEALRSAAEAHSLDMARRDYFEHDSPEGVKPWMRITRAGYRAALVGENLAWGEEPKSTPAHAMALWMESPGHRANVLEPRYTQIGIGLAFDAPDPEPSDRSAAIYTTTFGSAAAARR